MTIRVLLADDQVLVRSGIRLILELADGIEVVGEAGNGRDAVALAKQLRPEVILMDVRMPELDGIEATRLVHRADVASRVLVLTTFDLDVEPRCLGSRHERASSRLGARMRQWRPRR